MSIIELSNIIATLGISGLIGAYLNRRLQESSENRLRMRESKEKQYKTLLENLMGFFEGWEEYGVGGKNVRKRQFMWEVYTNVPIYASDEVIKLCYDYLASYSNDHTVRGQSDKIYAKIVIAIRKELNKIYGQPGTELLEKDIKILKLD